MKNVKPVAWALLIWFVLYALYHKSSTIISTAKPSFVEYKNHINLLIHVSTFRECVVTVKRFIIWLFDSDCPTESLPYTRWVRRLLRFSLLCCFFLRSFIVVAVVWLKSSWFSIFFCLFVCEFVNYNTLESATQSGFGAGCCR